MKISCVLQTPAGTRADADEAATRAAEVPAAGTAEYRDSIGVRTAAGNNVSKGLPGPAVSCI